MMRWRKYSEMMFLMSRNASKQGCRESKIHWRSVHISPLHRSSISLSLAGHQMNAVELATKVFFSLFDVDLT